MTLEQALAQAYRARPDYLAAQERVKSRGSISCRGVQRATAIGTVQRRLWRARSEARRIRWRPTPSPGQLSIPIFQGGRTQGRIAQADADLRQRRAEAEDMRAQIYYDVRAAFFDLQATGEQLQVATRSRELANQELTQARDRFAAGIANNLEVVQAQQSVATADEQYIDALLGYDVSKAVLARSLGDAEAAVQRILGPGTP